jgi:uncharacterized UPF0146 family protein
MQESQPINTPKESKYEGILAIHLLEHPKNLYQRVQKVGSGVEENVYIIPEYQLQ